MSHFEIPLPLTLDEIGVTDRHFHRFSEIHGCGHMNRVIYLAILIARTSGHRHLVPAVWAAAHLHDLARRNDCECHEHGAAAVRECLPKFLCLYRRGGVTPSDLPSICTAVAMHCLPEEIGSDHPHWLVTSLLKDADALDRVRINDLDPRFLRHERARDLVQFAAHLFAATGHRASFADVWAAANRLFQAPGADLSLHPYHWDAHETPNERRTRRLSAASVRPNAVIVDSSFWDPANEAEMALQQLCVFVTRQATPLASVARVLLPVLTPGIERIRAVANRLVPFTATRRLPDFLHSGTYLGFWEAGPSWHYHFVDNPEPVRLYHNLRIFGERDAYVTYGCLLDPQDPRIELQLAEMHATYGPDIIEWDPALLANASFCLNDSQKQQCVLPFDVEAWIKAKVLHEMARKAGGAWPLPLLPWSDPEFHFWEFQAHGVLTSSDIVAIHTGGVRTVHPAAVTVG